MSAGRQRFRAGDLASALTHYQAAVSAIDGLLAESPCAEGLLMAKVTTHLDRATALAAAGAYPAAQREHRLLAAFLAAILDEPGFPAALRRLACGLRGLLRGERQALADRPGANEVHPLH